MEEFEKYCTKKIKCLNKLISEGEAYLKNAPQGRLRISTQKNIPRYYWVCDPHNTQGVYIKSQNTKLAQQLAQKDYIEKFLPAARKERDILAEFITKYNLNNTETLYTSFSKQRQALIAPAILSDSEYTKRWEAQCVMQKQNIKSNFNYHHYTLDEDTGFSTEKGELVRSKSEKIIADKLFKMDIPYIYELPLVLNNNKILHPDFTVLNKRTRQQYYWEHFGLMDKNDYCEQAIKKLNTYAQNKIHQGRSLLTTYETPSNPLNIRRLEELIQEFLI